MARSPLSFIKDTLLLDFLNKHTPENINLGMDDMVNMGRQLIAKAQGVNVAGGTLTPMVNYSDVVEEVAPDETSPLLHNVVDQLNLPGKGPATGLRWKKEF